MSSPTTERSATKPHAKTSGNQGPGARTRSRAAPTSRISPSTTLRRVTHNSPISISISEHDRDQTTLSSDIPTSPIDDASAFPSGLVPGGTTRILPERSLAHIVQEQIASHKARKRLKVMKVPQRASSPDETAAETSSVACERSSPPPPVAKKETPAGKQRSKETTAKNQRSKRDIVKNQKTILDCGDPSTNPKRMDKSTIMSLRKLPSEFATIASEQYKLRTGATKDKQYLKGSCIFYCGSDFSNASETTKKRMWIVRLELVPIQLY